MAGRRRGDAQQSRLLPSEGCGARPARSAVARRRHRHSPARRSAPRGSPPRPAPQHELRSPAPSRAKRRPAPVGLNGTATAALIEKSLSLKSLQNQFLYKRIKSKLDTNSKISVEILSKTGYSIRSHSKTGRVAEPARGLAEQSV